MKGGLPKTQVVASQTTPLHRKAPVCAAASWSADVLNRFGSCVTSSNDPTHRSSAHHYSGHAIVSVNAPNSPGLKVLARMV